MSEQESKKPALTRSEIAGLLEVRRKIKERTPEFKRFESWRYVRIHEEWRKPKGVDNHMRLSARGWPHLVKIGYRVPKSVRYLHPSGYRDILVHNVAELEKLTPDRDAARIAATVGRRKKIEIVKRARELGIRMLNARNLLATAKTRRIWRRRERGKEITEEEERRKELSEWKRSAHIPWENVCLIPYGAWIHKEAPFGIVMVRIQS